MTLKSAYMELEPSRITMKPVSDPRPIMPEPPPVWLVAIEDVHSFAPAGLETQLDDFYGKLLRFEREGMEQGRLIYKAENFRLHLDVIEPPIAREEIRPLGIDVPSLSILQQQLIDREIEFEWQRGLMAGQESLLLQDPAGNWVQIGQFKRV